MVAEPAPAVGDLLRQILRNTDRAAEEFEHLRAAHREMQTRRQNFEDELATLHIAAQQLKSAGASRAAAQSIDTAVRRVLTIAGQFTDAYKRASDDAATTKQS